jgi:hypothetical protein
MPLPRSAPEVVGGRAKPGHDGEELLRAAIHAVAESALEVVGGRAKPSQAMTGKSCSGQPSTPLPRSAPEVVGGGAKPDHDGEEPVPRRSCLA